MDSVKIENGIYLSTQIWRHEDLHFSYEFYFHASQHQSLSLVTFLWC